MKNMFSKHNNESASESIYTQILPDNQKNVPLAKSLSDNLNMLRGLFSNCSDIVYREFAIDNINRNAAFIFIKDLVDIKLIDQSIITSLMNIKAVPLNNLFPGEITEIAKKHFLEIANIEEASTIGEAAYAILNGSSVFLLDGDIKGLSITTQGWKERNVPESKVEQTIRGPKEAFSESINTNTSQIRRKIKSTQLKFEEHIAGRLTQTKINITYLQGIADDNVVKEVRKRIERIDVDSILESGYIEELIEDTPYTLFPQVQHSERPDKVAAAILEGKVAVLIDGTPFALIMPVTCMQFFQSSADYYERYTTAFAIRIIRYIFIGISLLLPGCYVAIISYHREMVPTPLYISILLAAHGVPFPIFIEALLMEVTFEGLREAGIRLPALANQTVGIVGALIIGDAAVRAGIVSPVMVIIIAITGVASFSIPSYDMGYTIRILRFFMLFLGAVLGLYGIMLGFLVLLIHMASLRSFGEEYLSPMAPLDIKHLKAVIARFPWWYRDERTFMENLNDHYRQKHDLNQEIPVKDNGHEKGK